MSTTDTAALQAQLATLRAFLDDHPEVAAQLGMTSTQAPPPGPPLHISDLFHALVAHIPGIDDERRDQFRQVISDHFGEAEAPGAAAAAADVPRETLAAAPAHVASADPALALSTPAPAPPPAPASPPAANAPEAPAPAVPTSDDLPGV